MASNVGFDVNGIGEVTNHWDTGNCGTVGNVGHWELWDRGMILIF